MKLHKFTFPVVKGAGRRLGFNHQARRQRAADRLQPGRGAKMMEHRAHSRGKRAVVVLGSHPVAVRLAVT